MFFEQAKRGNNSFFAYLLTFFATFFLGYSIVGIIPLFYQLLKKSGTLKLIRETTDQQTKQNLINSGFEMLGNPLEYDKILGSKNEAFFLMTLIFLAAAIFFLFGIYFFQKKQLGWVLTGAEKFRWNLFGQAFGFGSILVFINVLTLLIFSPDEITYQLQWSTFIPLILISIVMIPIQAGWEEAFFRGWMMQGFGLLFKHKGLALLTTTLLFATAHMANPEVVEHGAATMFPIYFTISLSFGIMVLMSDGLELAMGFHIANNLFISMLMTTPESVLQTDAMFRTTDVQDYSGQIWSVILSNVIVLAIFAYRFKWTDWKTRLLGSIN